MNTQPLRVAIIGCGFHGQALAQAVLRSRKLELVACADPDDKARRSVAAMTDGVSPHPSAAEMLSVEQVDAVLVATSHDALAPTTLIAVRSGKHVMVEKPMALNEEQAREVESAAVNAGVTCMIGYSFRYGTAQRMGQLLGQGVIGDVQAVTGTIATGGMDEGWVARADSGGGPLLYVGCHLIDLALWFMGEDPNVVTASVNYRETGVDNSTAMTMEFSGDRLAQLLVTQSAPGFFYEVRVIGSAGLIGLRGRNFVQFEVDVQSEIVPAYHDPAVIRPALQRDHISMMLVPELEEFAASIAERRAPAITATDGRRVLRVMDAIGQSARTRRPVTLPPAPSAS